MSGTVSLLTDFGPGSVYVGEMHAVLRRLAPDVAVIDVAHDCPPGSVAAAAYLLGRAHRLLPDGSVHVVVVDPGVGTDRAILAARARGHLFVGPDNGVLAAVVEGGVVHRVTRRELWADRVSSTFHGRDVMAPVAACLATGTPLEAVGPPAVPQPVVSGPAVGSDGVLGRVLLEDAFGNLVTDIPRRLLEGTGGAKARVRVQAGDATLEGLSRTFADVAPGRPLAYVGSGDHLEIAVNGGRAADVLHLAVGDPVRVEARPS